MQKVERINLDGDIGVVNAARISFDNWKEKLDESDKGLIAYLIRENHKSPFFHPQIICLFQSKGGIKNLMSYYNKDLFQGIEICGKYVRFSVYSYEQLKDKLLQHKIIKSLSNRQLNKLITKYSLKDATTIVYLSFRVTCPFFVRNQLDRHRIGLCFNEVSRRYVNKSPEFWRPETARIQSKDKKQCSEGSAADSLSKEFLDWCSEAEHNSLIKYNYFIERGVANELCRINLPLSTYTAFVWTASLEDYARLYKERTHIHAQIETREYAILIGEFCEKEYPEAWAELTKNN